ncbi:DNA-binding TFAR19-related protein [Testicularia cyperi]|uniref:DNA-binding TFAR19-related protein n=1 Tax=Testicularia cyperi TaxID=1882483 RepID=A0A317XG76_9BASI|nr:DNA-binding TFAR19-related protein [Testicularia cyperi]
MEDDELQAIRAARMAELRGGAGSSGAGSSSGGPGGNNNNNGKNQEEQAAQQEEMKRQMLSRILDSEARERLSRIGLVKPQKARQITDLLIRMAQSGQLRGRVSEDQLIGLLDQVDQASGGADGGAPKITFTRKKTVQDDDDSDFDL